jgi:hypothetical protein
MVNHGSQSGQVCAHALHELPCIMCGEHACLAHRCAANMHVPGCKCRFCAELFFFFDRLHSFVLYIIVQQQLTMDVDAARQLLTQAPALLALLDEKSKLVESQAAQVMCVACSDCSAAHAC